ncbi:hypothetical protein BKA62DRAFT_716156 [Auriculariales sp. MPI-PUGE-AT-0066]|nr:hypothetical protein BKA62DRAFT_716156 [Auriculariales sp. MPI-PUGE-AT-0066]
MRFTGTRKPPEQIISHDHPEASKDAPEGKAKWLARNLLSSLPGRVVMSAYGTTVAKATNVTCLSPWGDDKTVVLPNVRVRDLFITAITSTTGLPVGNFVTDTIYESAVEQVMETEIARVQDLIERQRRPDVCRAPASQFIFLHSV